MVSVVLHISPGRADDQRDPLNPTNRLRVGLFHALIEGNGIDGTRRVIDFSGDSSWAGGGIPVAIARKAALDAGIVINGLAILCRACDSGRPGSAPTSATRSACSTSKPGRNR